jgi:hypothetical protein
MDRIKMHKRHIQLWRAQHPEVLIPLEHCCSKSGCKLLHLNAHVCTHCGIGLRRQCECCVRVRDSYVCPKTGYDHLCGALCSANNCGHCRITGNIIDCTSGGPVPQRQPAHTARSRLRAAQPHCIRPIVHALLYSEARIKFETHKRKQLRISAERAVHRMRRNAIAHKKPFIYTNAVIEYVHKYDRTAPLTHLHVDKATRDQVCTKYTRLVNRLIIAMHLKGVVVNKHESVVVVLLYFMRSGVSVRDETIMPVDPFLQGALVSAHAINTLLPAPVAYTSVKNAINVHLRTLNATQIATIRQLFE